MTYFVISNSDGDTYIEEMDEAGLLEKLNLDEYGDVELDFSKALSSLDSADTNYWQDGFLIIEGEIVTPQAIKVVTQITI